MNDPDLLEGSLAPGQVFGDRYQIRSQLGRGGMGEVYVAHDEVLDREVAVKVLRGEVASDAGRLERFEREAKAVAKLSHPNILEIFDFGAHDGICFAVTELLEGRSLSDHLRAQTEPMQWTRVCELGSAVADGLAAAHSRGVIHRDIKPANLFLTSDGRVKILDFGLARIDRPELGEDDATETLEGPLTTDGTVLGTLGYMSPEQVRGLQADERSDIFSLGCVLYEMVSGARAFERETGPETMVAILREEPRDLSESGVAVPLELEQTIERCLEKSPDKRFQSAADLAYSMRSASSVSATAVRRSARARSRGAARKWWLAAAAVAALTVAVALLSQLDLTLTHTPEVELVPNRIAVVPFENRTGDPSLDPFGALVSDRVSQGLTKLDEIEVVSAVQLEEAVGAAGGERRVETVASATLAGLVLRGVYDAMGDGVELQATLLNAQSGQIIRAFDPVAAPRDAPQEAIATIRDWTLIAVQDHLHPALAFGAGDRLPLYEAYREYRLWFETMGSGRWVQALEIDPEFHRARIGPAFAHVYGGAPKSEELLESLENADDLTVRQTHIVSAMRHHQERRWMHALSGMTWVLDDGQDDWVTRFALLTYAANSNRPALAVEHFESMGPPPFRLRGFNVRARGIAADAYHRLGRYDEELAVARQMKADSPGAHSPLRFEARALVGLGRLDELESLVAEVEMAPEGGVTAGASILHVGLYLKAHGYHAESVEMAERAATWFQTSAFRDEGSVLCENCLADCLMLAGRIEEAWEIYSRLGAADPEGQGGWNGALHFGMASARLGDVEFVWQMIEGLERMEEEEGEPGATAFERAVLFAELGEREEALRLLKEAIASGFHEFMLLHNELMFEPLREDPEFQEIVRPKG